MHTNSRGHGYGHGVHHYQTSTYRFIHGFNLVLSGGEHVCKPCEYPEPYHTLQLDFGAIGINMYDTICQALKERGFSTEYRKRKIVVLESSDLPLSDLQEILSKCWTGPIWTGWYRPDIQERKKTVGNWKIVLSRKNQEL